MPFIGGGHFIYLVLLLVVVLIIFGPGKLPEIGSGMGRAIREFKKSTSEITDQVTGAATTPPPTTPSTTAQQPSLPPVGPASTVDAKPEAAMPVDPAPVATGVTAEEKRSGG